jgi:competence protein ComEA
MRPFALSLLLLVAAPLLAEEKSGDTNSVAIDAKHPKRPAPMDLNSATVDELKTLPGITDELAQKIVAGRPYAGKDQLLKLIDKAAYEKIRPLVIAKTAKK